MNARSLSRPALGVVLIIVFFTLFRGMTNILNALLVPLTMIMVTEPESPGHRAVFMLAAVLVVFLFYPHQLVFMLLYVLMSSVYRMMKRQDISVGLRVLGLGILAGVGFWGAILGTDALFGTRIRAFMLMLAGGSLPRLLLIMLGEGLLIALLLVLGGRFLERRLNRVIYPGV